MTAHELLGVLQELSRRRPVFHSERDFQHELAWLIHQKGYAVRLEVPIRKRGSRSSHIDIRIGPTRKRTIGIELKYKTKKVKGLSIHEETFDLAGHSATPSGRYDFWRDVHRLELLKKAAVITNGFAVFLTNDSAYWHQARARTIGARFTTGNNTTAKGYLSWSWKPQQRIVGKERMKGIPLHNQYTLKWTEYSGLERTTFMVLVIEI